MNGNLTDGGSVFDQSFHRIQISGFHGVVQRRVPLSCLFVNLCRIEVDQKSKNFRLSELGCDVQWRFGQGKVELDAVR